MVRLGKWSHASYRSVVCVGPTISGKLAVFFTLSLLLIACAKEEKAEENSSQVQHVQTIQANVEKLEDTVEGIGTLRALQRVEIQAEVGGIVRRIFFEEADEVYEGERLLKIDDEKLNRQLEAQQSALNAAQATLLNASRTFSRLSELRETKVVSEDDYDEAETSLMKSAAEVRRIESEIDFIREQIEDTVVTAPFDGVISDSLVDEGDFVAVGEHLATVYRIRELEVEFSLAERFLGSVRVGQPVDISVAAFPDRRFEGKIDYVAPAADPATRDFLLKAKVDNSDGLLKPGVFARAVVTVDTHNKNPVIPEECLVSTREGYDLFIVREGVAHRRKVEIGLRKPGKVEIVDGLDVGEEVVRKGHMQLSDGEQVTIETSSNEKHPTQTNTRRKTPE